MGIESFSKVMAELFQQHNYRDMFDFWLEKIKPELELSKKREDEILELKTWILELKTWITGVAEYVNLDSKGD